ncbi:hypothetical protein [Agaribacterium sp. ZY112]|uniref:hypothetical protein n=1 Tax=Agaribacterium sp. ZY112 TaxID=3233574 RepID=UPI0035249B54
MIPSVIGEVLFINKELTFTGLKVSALAIIGLRAPSFIFGLVAKITQIVLKYTKESLPKGCIWVNAGHAVDAYLGDYW